MNIEDEEWVQHALIDYERKRCISKVLSMECKNAIPKGNNFGSDMLRLHMKVVLHSGDVVNKPLIFKAIPQTEMRKKFIKDANLHKIEAVMFTDVWPQIEKLRQEKEFGIERLSPICYGIKKGLEGYLLEDLSAIGYKMADRRKMLDFDHGKLVVNAHAQLHAISLVLIERGDLMPHDFSRNYFYDQANTMEPIITSNITNLANIIEEKWGPEWATYPAKLRELKKTAMEKFRECVKFNEANFNALIHSDCWLTNMMFRYNSEGKVQNVRLLDFQLSQYNNVGQDLQYFFHTSLDAKTQEKKEELLQIYYEKFRSSLSLYEYSGEVPTFERIRESYERASAFGVIVGLTFVPFIMQSEEAVPDDLEEFTKEFLSDKGPEPPKIELEELCDIIKGLLKHSSSIGLL